MIDRRRFLAVSASGVMAGAAAVAIPTSAAQAVTPTTAGLAVKMKSWSRLTGSTIHATDAHGRSFPLTVHSVIENQSDAGGRGESFHVVLRARSRNLPDGIYRLQASRPRRQR